MKSTYHEAMEKGVFPHEGGYTNDAADPGGPTNWGITIIDARKYWKASATPADVKAMPKLVAEDIYAKHYAAPMRYDELPAGVDYSVLDYGINSGIGRSGKVLRRVCGMSDSTWTVTDEVIAAVNKRDPEKLIAAINDERLRFLMSLKTWKVFGPGWGRRVREVRALSLHFADEVKHAAPSIVPTPSNETMAKGQHAPTPPAVKDVVIKGGVPAGASGGGIAHLMGAHPVMTGFAIAGSIVVIGGIAYAVHRRHQAKQEAPTPGLVPVPPSPRPVPVAA